MSNTQNLIWLAFTWIGYGLIHSALASSSLKCWLRHSFPGGFRAYRLVYNSVATLLLIPPLWLLYRYPGTPLWEWPTAMLWIGNGLALAAIAGFLWSLRTYDSSEFLGLKQLRDTADTDTASLLRISWLHRWVRHPWYFFGLVILWTREMNSALLVSTLIITVYLVVGSRLEEQKLLQEHGAAYRAYRKQVPGLLPRPWRFLSARDAAAILRQQD
jgi:protein-S-isoprenylcysteine O-methyltransferase Ste14